jgi:hypothetical protein
MGSNSLAGALQRLAALPAIRGSGGGGIVSCPRHPASCRQRGAAHCCHCTSVSRSSVIAPDASSLPPPSTSAPPNRPSLWRVATSAPRAHICMRMQKADLQTGKNKAGLRDKHRGLKVEWLTGLSRVWHFSLS